MENNVRLLEGDKIASQEGNVVSVNFKPTKASRRYVEELEEENRRLKIKNQEYQHYINEMGKELVREHSHAPTLWVC